MRRPRVQRSRLVAVVVFVLSVTLCAAAVRLSEAGLEHQKISGHVGETVAVEGGWIKVDNVRIGTTLARREAGDAPETVGRTSGMFVAAEVTVAATGEDFVSFAQANLVSENRAYAAWNDPTLIAYAGFSSGEDVVWEVDPAVIDELTVQLLPGRFVHGFDQQPAISLGIDSGNASAWREAARGRTVIERRQTITVGLS